MLVLHPSSRCDVCLDGYHGSKEPLAIPCGHIFCQWCLQSLPKPQCPLCRIEFGAQDVRRLHVDKTALPPSTPAFTSSDLELLASHARKLQSAITRVVLEGVSVNEFREILSEVNIWLGMQDAAQFGDLRAAYTLLYRCHDLKAKLSDEKRRVADVEQTCSDLKAQLEDERESFQSQLEDEREAATEKYEELERKLLDECEFLRNIEKTLAMDKERLQKECEEWRTKCDEVTAECRRLGDELDKLKRPPPPYRPVESRYFYLHDQTGAKAELVALVKDGLDSSDTTKVQIKDNIFHLSPVPATQPIPDLPPSIMSILPLTDELDDPIDDDRSHNGTHPVSVSSASRSIPIKSRSDSHRDRARSNSSLLARPDPDAMSISVPRSNLDVQMGSCSTSPSSAQHGPRPAEFAPGSVGRSSENILGLRADSNRVSPSAVDPELREQQERSKMLAQLRDVLQDPSPGQSPRKSSISSGIDRERARTAAPSAFTTTRTPSPVSTSSRTEYGPAPMKSSLLSVPNPTAISCASHAAAERERARASSVNSQNAPSPSPQPPSGPPHHPGPAISSTSLSHITATRDRENATPLHSIYAGAAPQPQSQPRPPHTRKHSAETSSLSSVSGSISKGKASAMGIAPSSAYPSGLTRSMRAMQEAPRVS